MALEAYYELEKQQNLTSPQGSLDEDVRLSLDSERDLHELDPLNHNGGALSNGHDDSNNLLHKSKWREEVPAWRNERWHQIQRGTSAVRSYIERYIPLSKIENSTHVKKLRRLLPATRIRRLRKRFGLTVPGRIMGFTAIIFAVLTFLVIVPGGTYIYKKGTLDGQSPPWYPSPLGGTCKRWEDSYKKAAKLVGRMTLAEKVNVTTGTGWMMGMCVGNTGPAVQAGFPALCLQDGPLGLRWADHITATPAGITVGATWNKDLMYKRGRLLGVEARIKGINVLLGPSVGPLGRAPAGGRNWEGFGADPVLQGIAAAQTIKGIQDEGVIATIKHFVGNEQEHFRQSFEWGLPNAMSSNIDDRTLHELYAWPFADSVKAGVGSAMCSYNQVNNSYACQNSKLINGILKDELGFQGFIQSDWLAQRSGVASALAGLDMSMPGDGAHWTDGKSFWGPHLSRAALNGSLPMERLNDMATRVVAAWYQLGQDDKKKWPRPPPEGKGGPNFSSWTNEKIGLLHPGSDDESVGVVNEFLDASNSGTFSHRSLARAIAAEGIVLLKNDGNVLPLTRDGWSESYGDAFADSNKVHIAVVGEDSTGAEGGPNACPDRGCNKGTLASGWGSGAVEFPYLITPLEAIQEAFHKDKVEITSFPTNALPSTLKNSTIELQDYCIVFVNADGGEGFISSEGIKGDRNDLEIQHHGNALIADVASRCGARNPRNPDLESGKSVTNTIVVIHAVGPVLVEPFINIPNIHAVLLANLPGQESGNAIADVLVGDVNPSGHLPYTIGTSLESYGPGAKIMYYPNGIVPQQDFSEGLFIDYRHFDAQESEPRYPFGHGLSYATFELRDLVISPKDPSPDLLPPPRPKDQVKPPSYRKEKPSPSEVTWPSGIRRLKKYVYPYLTEEEATSERSASNSQSPTIEERHEKSQAGGGEGGHPALWETIATVEVTVVNTGTRDGQAVVQLYVGFPDDVVELDDAADRRAEPTTGADSKDKVVFPKRVLRGFEKVHTYSHDAALAGSPLGQGAQGAKQGDGEWAYASKKVEFQLTRRDLSYWSVRRQNWVLPRGRFRVEVGWSSRDLPAKGTLF